MDNFLKTGSCIRLLRFIFTSGIIFIFCYPPSLCQKPELVIRSGSIFGCYGIAISPDKKIFVSLSERLIIIWDIETGKQIRALKGHESLTWCAAFSTDGKILASGGDDHKVILWDMTTGKLLHSFEGFKGRINSIAFSPTENVIAISDEYGGVHRLNYMSYNDTLISNAFNCYKVCFNSDGLLLAAFSMIFSPKDSTFTGKYLLTVWDTKTLQIISEYELPDTASYQFGSTITLGFSRNEVLAAIPNKKLKYNNATDISIWNQNRKISNDNIVVRDTVHSHSLAYDCNQDILVTAGNFKLNIWKVSEKNLLYTLNESCEYPTFSNDGNLLVWYSENNGSFLVWDVRNRCVLKRIIDERYIEPSRLVYLKNHQMIIYSIDKGVLKYWDLREGSSKTKKIDDPGNKSWSGIIGLSRDSSALIYLTQIINVSDTVFSITRFDLNTFKNTHQIIYRGEFDFLRISLSPFENSIFIISNMIPSRYSDQELGISTYSIEQIDLASGITKNMIIDTGRATSAQLSEDGNYIAIAYELKSVNKEDIYNVRIYNTITLKQNSHHFYHKRWISSMLFSRRNDTLYTINVYRVIGVWDFNNNKLLSFFYDSSYYHGWYMGASLLKWAENNLIIGVGDYSLRMWNIQTGKVTKIFKGHESIINSVIPFLNDSTILSSSIDGTIRIWNTTTGNEIAKLIVFENNEWIVVTPDGLFDASPGAMDKIHYVVGLETIDLKQLKARYYEPGLLSKVLGFNKDPMRKTQGFNDVKLFPETLLGELHPDSTHLTINIKNRGGGIGKVQVFVNGKEYIADAANKVNPLKDSVTVRVDLSDAPVVAGDTNRIRVVSWNFDGYLSSRGKEVIWIPRGESLLRTPTLYAIVSGTSTYAAPNLKLKYPAKDAEDFALALSVGAKRLFGADKVKMTLLSTSGKSGTTLPTKENIKKVFEDTKQAKPWDVFVVYFAGHGVTVQESNGTYCLLTQDAWTSTLTDPAIRAQMSITSEELTEWVKAIPAKKQVMIIDACNAGAAAEKFLAKRDVSSDQIRAIDRLKDRTGFHVIMGCAADAVSYEANQFGQGLLTYSLLQGMKGAALRENEYVDVSTLFQYAADQVPLLAQQIGGIQKPVIAAPQGTSFDVGRLNKEDKEEIPLTMIKPMLLRPILINSEIGYDNLDLMTLLRKSLSEENYTSTRDSKKESETVYIDVDELPGAIRPTGTYTIKGNQVRIKLFLRKDDKMLTALNITGTDEKKDELTAKLVEAIKQAVRKP